MTLLGHGKRVALAMSGGVDSTVVALMLKRQGYDLVGVYMRNWDEREEGVQCTSEAAWQRVQSVCKKLEIECHQVNFIKEYWNLVFRKMLDDYQRGLTPSPDLGCNRHIKFGLLLNHCRQKFNADTLATGHYAQLRRSADGGDDVEMLKARDATRDQTYFLASVEQMSLRHALFPLGNILKRDVYRIARDAGFHEIATQPESRGLCFVGKRRFSDFLDEYLIQKPGPIAFLNGYVVGRHTGLFHYTLGQRASFEWTPKVRLGVSKSQYYVCRRDTKHNCLYIVDSGEHAALYSDRFTTQAPMWIAGRAPGDFTPGTSKIVSLRCCAEAEVGEAELSWDEGDCGGLRIRLSEAGRSITPGQVAIFYDGDVCLGCAEIKDVELAKPFQISEPYE